MIGLSTQKDLHVSSTEELLHALVEYSELDRLNFSQIGGSHVYNVPLKSSRQVSLDNNYVNDRGVVIRLNLPQQLMLLHLLSQKYELQLRHGSLKENLEAAYHPSGEEYKRNVLDPYWVFTGEMIGPDGVYKTLGIEEQQIQPEYQLVSGGRQLIQLPTDIPQIKLTDRVVQRELPTKTGYFDRFIGAIPVNREIKSQIGKGYWTGMFPDEHGWSAVGCYWFSVVWSLVADASWPLSSGNGGALGIWTDEV